MAHETHLSGPTSAPEVLSQGKTGRPLTNVPSAHNSIKIDGYEITRTEIGLRIEELSGEMTKSWQAMLNFCERYPTGNEPQWDVFVRKHTAMQKREVDAVVAEYRRRIAEGDCG